MTIQRVGIMSPGDMGAAIGNVLHAHGLEVATCLAGRSDLTRLRAAEAGFRDHASLDDLVAGCDLLISVLVPSEALPLARAVAASMQRTGARPAYTDLNAIAPQTVRQAEALIAAQGATFIDGGIIGSPPRLEGRSGRFCISGPDTSTFEALAQHGLEVRVVGNAVGQASGLKMLYAAQSKGTTAVWTEVMVAARALGLEEALRLELGDGVRGANSITSMPRRARRWVSEMEEIAATYAALGLTPKIYEGAAALYGFVGETSLADQSEREPDPSLDDVLTALARHLND